MQENPYRAPSGSETPLHIRSKRHQYWRLTPRVLLWYIVIHLGVVSVTCLVVVGEQCNVNMPLPLGLALVSVVQLTAPLVFPLVLVSTVLLLFTFVRKRMWLPAALVDEVLSITHIVLCLVILMK
jgi:hypothetical protein